jgi:PAS domain S-box-containing protein
MSTSADQSPATLKLRPFIDAVLAIAWSSLPDGSLDFINQRFRDYTGLSSDQLTGLKWKSAVHPDDIQKLETWWQHLSQSQEAATTEKRLRRFDGAYRWFQIAAAPVHDEQSNLIRWCGINTDIDDLKQTEEGLRASERSWRQIVDCIPGFVTTATAAGEVEFFNQQSLNYFGRTLEELKSWMTIDVIHPSDLPQVIAGFRHSIETGQPWDIVERLRRADGVYRWFQSHIVPQRDAEGRIIRWFSSMADIDDRKRAENELQKAFDEIKKLKDQLFEENIALRQEIDQASLFEEIVAPRKRSATHWRKSPKSHRLIPPF